MFVRHLGGMDTHSESRKLPFLDSEELGRFREVGKVEVDHHADDESRNTFKDELKDKSSILSAQRR